MLLKTEAEVQVVPEPVTWMLEAAMVVVDYQQAAVQALVGGKTAGYAGFNRALDARRPIGSLIKPPIYLEALAQESLQPMILTGKASRDAHQLEMSTDAR